MQKKPITLSRQSQEWESDKFHFYQVYAAQAVVPQHRLWQCRYFFGDWELVLRQKNLQYFDSSHYDTSVNPNTPFGDLFSVMDTVEEKRWDLKLFA